MHGMPVLVAPPREFSGTIGELVDELVIPNLPPMDPLLEWTEVLVRYALEDPDPKHLETSKDSRFGLLHSPD